MRCVQRKTDIFHFCSISKSFDLLFQGCNSLAHLRQKTQGCPIKVYKIQEFEPISGLVFSLELSEHTPLPALLASAPASSSSETPPAPHYSGAAAGFPPAMAAGTGVIVGSLCHPICILLKICLTVSAKTFLYVSQSFCRILWVSSASLSFSESAW